MKLASMSAMNLNLSDRTVVMAGSFGPLVQSLASALTENGADVAMVVEDSKVAQRFCQNLMDLREVSERYGRAVAIESEMTDAADIDEAFSRSAEVFGTTDIYIDTHIYNAGLPGGPIQDLDGFEKSFSAAFDKASAVGRTALKYLRHRSKSRLLLVAHELDLHYLKQTKSNLPNQFLDFVHSLSLETGKESITVNALAIGPTEEYLMSRHPKKASIRESFKILQEDWPSARLVDYSDISAFISFLASPLSAALSGQLIKLNHGLNS